jgi:hypothetical protein
LVFWVKGEVRPAFHSSRVAVKVHLIKKVFFFQVDFQKGKAMFERKKQRIYRFIAEQTVIQKARQDSRNLIHRQKILDGEGGVLCQKDAGGN